MIGFLIAAGVMALMVAAALVFAVRKASAAGGSPVVAGHEDLAIYRDQLLEVDRDLARGVIPVAEAGRLRIEVQRRMLEADRMSRPTKAVVPVSFGLASALVVVALLGAGVLYGALGQLGYPDVPLAGRIASAAADYQNRPHQATLEAKVPAFAAPADMAPATVAMMDQLRATVAGRPDDLKGQTLLAQSEYKLGNLVGAEKAQAAVVWLKAGDATAQDYGTLAELMIGAAGGIVTPEAEAVLNEVVKRDPTDGSARFYIGLMAAQVGRPDRTFMIWQPLLDAGPADAPWIAPIRSMIQNVADAAGIQYTLPAETGPSASGPDASAVANAAQMTPEARQKMIEGMVVGLESRLMAGGGAVGDWTKLINALGVLGAKDRANAAYIKSQADFAGHPGELSALQAAAVQAGLAP